VIIQTFHGFAVTDVIFGVALVVFFGMPDVTAYFAYAFAELNSPLLRSTIAVKASAPAEGAGKRVLNHNCIGFSKVLAIDDSNARSETAGLTFSR